MRLAGNCSFEAVQARPAGFFEMKARMLSWSRNEPEVDRTLVLARFCHSWINYKLNSSVCLADGLEDVQC